MTIRVEPAGAGPVEACGLSVPPGGLRFAPGEIDAGTLAAIEGDPRLAVREIPDARAVEGVGAAAAEALAACGIVDAEQLAELPDDAAAALADASEKLRGLPRWREAARKALEAPAPEAAPAED